MSVKVNIQDEITNIQKQTWGMVPRGILLGEYVREQKMKKRIKKGTMEVCRRSGWYEEVLPVLEMPGLKDSRVTRALSTSVMGPIISVPH